MKSYDCVNCAANCSFDAFSNPALRTTDFFISIMNSLLAIVYKYLYMGLRISAEDGKSVQTPPPNQLQKAPFVSATLSYTSGTGSQESFQQNKLAASNIRLKHRFFSQLTLDVPSNPPNSAPPFLVVHAEV